MLTRSYRRLALAVVSAVVLGWTGIAHGTTFVVHPAADTYVDQLNPNTNHGLNSRLRIRNHGTGQGLYSFVRFDLPTLDGDVLSATLTLRTAGMIHEVGYFHVQMGQPAWGETNLTWNNWQNGTSFQQLGAASFLAAEQNLAIDVTNWIGSTPVTFALASAGDFFGQTFYSRETAFKPELTIETDSSPPVPPCTNPGKLLAELDHLLRTGSLLNDCNYKPNLDDFEFRKWRGASENLPVIAAAIALFDGPEINGIDYRLWWDAFFDHQESQTGSGNIDYFKGSELFSTVYDSHTVAGVIAANYWADSNGHSALRSQAEDYLRRTWYAWALATSPEAAVRIYKNEGVTRTLGASSNRKCPTPALASSRSKVDYYQDSKRWMMAKFLGYDTDCYKSQSLKKLLDHIASQYSKASGLTVQETSDLRALIERTTIPNNLASVFGSVRMRTDVHFLLWNDGRRATFYLGHQVNNNVNNSGGKGTVFTAFFDRSTRELDLLFTLGKNNNSCLQSATRQIYVDDKGVGCFSSRWFTLPANPDHHFVLGPNGFRSCTTLGC